MAKDKKSRESTREASHVDTYACAGSVGDQLSELGSWTDSVIDVLGDPSEQVEITVATMDPSQHRKY